MAGCLCDSSVSLPMAVSVTRLSLPMAVSVTRLCLCLWLSVSVVTRLCLCLWLSVSVVTRLSLPMALLFLSSPAFSYSFMFSFSPLVM